MKRRSVIKGLLAAGVAGAAGFGGFTWYQVKKSPDIAGIEDEKGFLAMLAETIIPETDSPGAISAGVESFIINMLKYRLPHRDVNRFLDGMDEVKDIAQSSFNQKFEECDQEQREFILSRMEEQESTNALVVKVKDRLLGRSFMRSLKFLTCVGFAYSQQGATRAFRYVQVPGQYKSNIPLEPGDTSWVLS